MRTFRKPKDRFVPFYTLKHATMPVPDPATAAADELHLPAIFTNREPLFKRGKSSILMRFSARMITFKRMQDAEGNWHWAYPIEIVGDPVRN
jgi:hypothetical protein